MCVLGENTSEHTLEESVKSIARIITASIRPIVRLLLLIVLDLRRSTVEKSRKTVKEILRLILLRI
jgi:hypothetical protein